MTPPKFLALGDDLKLPRDLLTRRTAVVGQTDTGKTSTAVVVVEEARKLGAQVVVIDPSGAWWGVTSSADGKSAGLDMVVLGGEHGELPLNESAGRACARIVAERGISAVLDLDRPHFRSWAARQRFVADFLSELYEEVRAHVLVVIDECHRFAPQAVRDESGDAARCLGAVVDAVALARRRGVAVLAITQRLAKLHKDVLELCEVMIAHRLRGNNDRKALQGWLDDAGEDVKAIMAEIGRLKRGVARVSAPTLGVDGVYTIRPKWTFDSSRTIEPGEVAIQPSARSEADLAELRDLLADTIAQAEADDPKKLRERIAALEQQLADTTATGSVETVEAGLADAEDRIRDLERQLADRDALERQVSALVATVRLADDELREHEEAVGRIRRGVLNVEDSTWLDVRPARESKERPIPAGAQASRGPDAATSSVAGRGKPPETPAPPAGPDDLSVTARKILAAIAVRHPLRFTRPQVARLGDYAQRGGAFVGGFGELKRGGYIEEHNGEVEVTPKGLALSGVETPKPPTTAEEAIDMWRAVLDPSERKVFDAIVRMGRITKTRLAGATGYTASGGRFIGIVGVLVRNGLVERRGEYVQLSERATAARAAA